jgi:hypothetical protein
MDDKTSARMHSSLVGLLACILEHYDGNEQDLDVIAAEIIADFDLAEEVEDARARNEEG